MKTTETCLCACGCKEEIEEIEDATRCEQCGNLTQDGHFQKNLSRCCSACGFTRR
jgi:hypothetical protein